VGRHGPAVRFVVRVLGGVWALFPLLGVGGCRVAPRGESMRLLWRLPTNVVGTAVLQ